MNDKRILGIDFGTSRIGISVSDPLRIIAQGIATVRNREGVLEEIHELAKRYDVGFVVVGMPYTLRGEKGVKAGEVDRFIAKLRRVLALEIVALDERFTSRIAQQTLLTMGTKRKERRENKGRVDAMASALILQSFLDQTKHSTSC